MENDRRSGRSLGYFNLARGMGMVFIIFGHSMNLYLKDSKGMYFSSGLGSVLGGGILAAFFMISGFGFYKRSPKKCFSIQTKLLLRPYCLVAAAVLLTKVLLALIKRRSFWNSGGELVLTYLLGLNAEGGGEISGIPIESISIFWFVLALFGGWIIYNRIVQLHSKHLRFVCVCGCVILSYLLTLISKIWPYCIPMALLAVGYLAAGDYMKKKGLLDKKIRPVWWMLIAGIIALSSAFGEINVVACVWKLGLIDVAATFCMGFLFLRLYARLMRHDWKGRIIGILEEIGFNSIWIVCLHAYEKIIFPWYRIAEAFAENMWLGVFLCFAGRCIVMYVLYKFVSIITGKIRKKKAKKIVLT